jgi:Zn-dependent protease with chaperone function
MQLFDALYFGPGIPPQGERIPIRIKPEGLTLRPGAPTEEILPFEILRVMAGGFHHDQITLTWSKEEKTWSLILSDPHAKERFLETAPPFLAPQLTRWRKQTARIQRGMRLGSLLLGLFILFPLLLGLALWWKSDAIAEWVVHRISHSSEVKLGDLIYEQTRVGLTLLPEGETTKMVQEIGSRLTKESPYPFRWHVADDPTINAFAIPGGHIVVFTGLIQGADSAEEVAGVLAHEAEHVLQRHSLKGIVHQFGWRVVLTLLIGDLQGGPIGEMAAQLQVLRFGRDQESEADFKGLALLKRAQIDPNGMITFFDRLSKKEGASLPLLSTHPPSTDRAEALRAEINRLGPWPSKPLPYNWDAIKKELKKNR